MRNIFEFEEWAREYAASTDNSKIIGYYRYTGWVGEHSFSFNFFNF